MLSAIKSPIVRSMSRLATSASFKSVRDRSLLDASSGATPLSSLYATTTSTACSTFAAATFATLQRRAYSLPAHGGGKLLDLVATGAKHEKLRKEATTLPQLRLNQRHLCDIELILNGAFSPLDGFMEKADYESVCENLRLTNGVLFPMPITLDVTEEQASKLQIGQRVTLIDSESDQIAIMTIKSLWRPNRERESDLVFGTREFGHSGAQYLLEQSGPVYIGGPVEGLQLPAHYDYASMRQTPHELRKMFKEHGWTKVVAFQTRNPMHRAHRELTVRAAEQEGAKILIHPVVGMTKPGDVDHHTRVKCYKAITSSYPPNTMMLSLLNLAMRMGGPREAVLHAIIRKNYGATHFIVGRDHAGPGDNAAGKPFYGPYDAQTMVQQYAKELEIKPLFFQAMLYVPEHDTYYPDDKLPAGLKTLNISGTELRRRLRSGEEIPGTMRCISKPHDPSNPAIELLISL